MGSPSRVSKGWGTASWDLAPADLQPKGVLWAQPIFSLEDRVVFLGKFNKLVHSSRRATKVDKVGHRGFGINQRGDKALGVWVARRAEQDSSLQHNDGQLLA